MRRRLLNLLTVLSLLLCVVVCVLWVRSYRVSEDIYPNGFRFYQRHGPVAHSFHLRSGAGGLWLNVAWPDQRPTPEELERIRDNFPHVGWEVYPFPPQYPRLRVAAVAFSWLGGARPAAPPEPRQPLSWRLLGIDWKSEPSRTDFATYTVYRLVFPYWMPAVLLSALPALRLPPMLRRWKSRGRSALGLCPACGYDLRATPDRCPECGTRASASGAQ